MGLSNVGETVKDNIMKTQNNSLNICSTNQSKRSGFQQANISILINDKFRKLHPQQNNTASLRFYLFSITDYSFMRYTSLKI